MKSNRSVSRWLPGLQQGEEEAAARIRLVGEGRVWQPKASSRGDARDPLTHGVSFEGPFPEKARLRIELPENLVDDAGRHLANAGRFPLGPLLGQQRDGTGAHCCRGAKAAAVREGGSPQQVMHQHRSAVWTAPRPRPAKQTMQEGGAGLLRPCETGDLIHQRSRQGLASE